METRYFLKDEKLHQVQTVRASKMNPETLERVAELSTSTDESIEK